MFKRSKRKFKQIFFYIEIIILAFFLSCLYSISISILSLESYLENVQPWLFGPLLFTSFLALFYYLFKRNYLEALLAFVLPLLIYDYINFSTETILYGKEMIEGKIHTKEEIANIVVSLGDLKIIFSAIALILWCLAWERIKKGKI